MAGLDTHLLTPRNAREAVGKQVAFAAKDAPEAAWEQTTTKVAGVPREGEAGKATTQRGRASWRARRGHGGGWDADEVAVHLMACQTQMVRGLARKSPWAGLDDETLASCFGHGAAVIARVAASGQRPEWRTSKDLEKAQIAAFRHQALDYWKRANAQSRRGERFTVAFDPERHGHGHAPIDRLFEQPDLHTIERDLLAELTDDGLRAFWTIVLQAQVSFKEAGDRLQLTKAEVMACTRVGRIAFGGYLDRRSTGELCVERSLDLAARRAGSATPLQAERAAAHVESCYACALVHDPSTSALQRGILGLAPTGLILRLLSRAGDVVASPVTRIVDSGSGSRAVATGLAAVAVAGSGLGIDAATDTSPKPQERGTSARKAAPRVAPATPAVASVPARPTPPAVLDPSPGRSAAPVAAPVRTLRPKRASETKSERRSASPAPVAPTPAPTPAPAEFGFERSTTTASATPPVRAPLAPAPESSPPANEFALP